ncbi:amino acid ABC transporter permease [Mycoplasmatota bacterium]|nr:amino acid ABC transporter permease [Mycoplasmatota bacterium]
MIFLRYVLSGTVKIVPDGTFQRMVFIVQNYYPMFLEGLKYTLVISLVGTLFGVLIGMILASMKIQKITKRDSFTIRILKRAGIIFSTAYVDIVRGTPMMLQAIILYYAFFVKWFNMSVMLAGIIIISLNTAAYATEVLRGAINAIDKGQMEAARSLGMSYKQAMLNVILPQAFKNSVPAIGNELVINIKDSSVLSVIGVIELMYQSKAAASQYFLHVESALVAGVVYLILTMSATRLLEYFDKRLNSPSGSALKISIPTSQSFQSRKRGNAKWRL